jgi:excisionase family DNA binding protein
MIEDMHNTQTMADIFKGAILDDTSPKKARLGALNAIKQLERCGWHGPAMKAALAEAGVGFDNGSNTITRLENGADSITKAISIYLESIGYTFDPFEGIYTTEEAADYLGISREMMITYASREKRIRGKMIGRSMVFTRAQLDEFKEQMRPRGNPGKKL